MSHRPQVTFARIATPAKGAVVVLAADGMGLGEAARTCNPDGVLERAAKINDFKGALAATLDVVAPSGTDFDRLVAVRPRSRQRAGQMCSVPWNSPIAPGSWRSSGVEVEILDEKQLKKLGMRALLGVAQGSERRARVAIMRWNGGQESDKPLAFIGKGVVFDTGGISIKPAAGMEDMKGDMAGAACVVGLMHALAARKAKANVIGAIGLVENMPDGNAQRPGDIVTSMSGQTIEIINTDAEGRLVLADVLWYVRQERLQAAVHDRSRDADRRHPRGARHDHAGLFSNDDELAEKLSAGQGDRREGLAHAARPRLRQADRFQVRRHEEHRRTPCGLDHRGAVPAALRQGRRPGRISTSPAPAWPRRRATSTSPGARATACGCSIASSPELREGPPAPAMRMARRCGSSSRGRSRPICRAMRVVLSCSMDMTRNSLRLRGGNGPR
jgi:hypothetical protein